jgi:hypothetical protein
MAADFQSTIEALERELAAAGELPHSSRVGTLVRLVDRIKALPTLHRSRACALLVDASIAYSLYRSESEKAIGTIALAFGMAEQIDDNPLLP